MRSVGVLLPRRRACEEWWTLQNWARQLLVKRLQHIRAFALLNRLFLWLLLTVCPYLDRRLRLVFHAVKFMAEPAVPDCRIEGLNELVFYFLHNLPPVLLVSGLVGAFRGCHYFLAVQFAT